MPTATEAILVTELAALCVNVSSPTEAASGPLPMAGTDPTCFVATVDVCASPTLNKTAVSAGSGLAEVANDGREEIEEFSVKDMIPALVTTDAAPGPLSIAGTKPACFVLGPDAVALFATLEDGAGNVGATVIDGASDAGSPDVGKGFAKNVGVSFDSIEAAPKPSPTAGTEPTCLDGPALDTEASCTTGDSCAPTGDVEMMGVELRVAEPRP